MTHPLLMILLVLVSLLAWGRAEAAKYPYQSCFEVASTLHEVPLDVLLAVAATESAWNPDARSAANAHGIMQIQWPGTARHLGVTRLSELYNPCLNIELGARYLRELLDANGGDLDRALAAYNYGPTRIAAVDELPGGARRYVSTVGGHRQRILGQAEAATDRAAAAAGQTMVFDHPVRARRYAALLNERIDAAEFHYQAAAEGFEVIMKIAPEGLSLKDVSLLTTLGWPGMEAPR